MEYLGIDIVKNHLNLEADYHDDDEYILGLIQTAREAVEVHCNSDFDVIAAANGGELPAPLLQAQLLMIENLYQNRGIVGLKTVTLPRNYDYLIDLYRNYN
jgi:hypothetical protein